jgi:hypothetical protein
MTTRRTALALLATLSAAPALAGTPELPIQTTEVSQRTTAYLPLWLREHTWPNGPSARGGALAVADRVVWVASGDGRFFRVDLARGLVQPNALPAIDLGSRSLAGSRRYASFEVPPRVHDLLLDGRDVYVCFNRYVASTDSIHFNIARLAPNGSSWITLYRSPALDAPLYTMGNGGRLALQAGTRRLFFTVGDQSLDRINHRPSDIAPQRPDQPWGKIGYLDLRDNSVHRYSLGHRNPQGLTFLADGRLFASEHGPQGGDEINDIREGGNYGWPYRSHGTQYGSFSEYRVSLPAPPAGTRFVEPLYAFVPSVAPTQLIQLQGFHDRWDGDLLLATLRAQTLYRLKLDADRIVYAEPIPLERRLRDVRQMGDTLVILTDDGSLLTLRRNPKPLDRL